MSDAYEVRIRKGVFNAIDAAKGSYVINDSDLKQTFAPREELENIGEKPFIKVVSVGHSAERDRRLRDATKVVLTLPVQIAIQQRVQIDNLEAIDKILRMVEQIRETIEDDELVPDEDFTWSHTTPLQDEEGNTYSYEDLIQKGAFTVIFTSYYTYVKQP